MADDHFCKDDQILHGIIGVPGQVRTQRLFSEKTLASVERSIRRRMLYPAELQDQVRKIKGLRGFVEETF